MSDPTTKNFEAINFDSPDLHYLHPTTLPKPTTDDDGRKATLIAAKGTNWWHTPDCDAQDALAWGAWRDLNDEGFEVRVMAHLIHKNQCVNSSARDDQACLFIYIGHHIWIKAGVEFDMGQLWDGAAVCEPFSDWAIASSSSTSVFTISYHPPTQEVRIYVNDQLIRKVNAFANIPGYIAAQGEGLSEFDKSQDGGGGKKVFVGVMAASPMGDGEKTRAIFRNFESRQGVRPAI